jgi:CelD/BcsL family acetyltransferase involved in cellulose biosynthesis
LKHEVGAAQLQAWVGRSEGLERERTDIMMRSVAVSNRTGRGWWTSEGHASSGSRFDVTIAQQDEEVKALRHVWRSFSWPSVSADLDYFLAVCRTQPNVVRPHVLVLSREGSPAAMVMARIEDVALECRLGYKPIYRPRIRLANVVPGGIAGADDEDLSRTVLTELHASLVGGAVDAISLPALRVDSPVLQAARDIAPFFCREHGLQKTRHWMLELPESYEAFLASRSRNTRHKVRQLEKRARRELGSRLTVRVFTRTDDLDQLVADLATVVTKTYQHGLGVAFVDTEAEHEAMTLAAQQGWLRGYVLYVDDHPVAYWYGNVYGTSFTTKETGYDPAYAEYRVGIFLLMRVIEDLSEVGGVQTVDFAAGDREFKRRFATDSWEESSMFLFAPTLRAVRLNVARTAIIGTSRLAKGVLGRVGLLGTVRNSWRRRLASPPRG